MEISLLFNNGISFPSGSKLQNEAGSACFVRKFLKGE